MTDIPEATLSKAREIYESSWPDPVRAIAEALMEASTGGHKLTAAFTRQADNMAFILNHISMPDHWYEKFSRELEEDRNALIPTSQGEIGMTTINIETSPEGIILSQACPSPEWSITGAGGRTDMIFIPRDQVPALIKALQPIAHEILEEQSL